MLNMPQAIAADIIRKAACDALELGDHLQSVHVGCSYDVWYVNNNQHTFSEKRAMSFQARASAVRDNLHLLGFVW